VTSAAAEAISAIEETKSRSAKRTVRQRGCLPPCGGGRREAPGGGTRDELNKIVPAGRSTLGRPGMRGGVKRRGR
jgi:hypothetical protein